MVILVLAGVAGTLLRHSLHPRQDRIARLLPSWVGSRESALLGLIVMLVVMGICFFLTGRAALPEF